MITAALVLWLVSWRYRVRPRTADEHAEGSLHRHDTVDMGGDRWLCLQCPRTESYNPPWSAADYLTTLVCAGLTAALLYLSYTIGGWFM